MYAKKILMNKPTVAQCQQFSFSEKNPQYDPTEFCNMVEGFFCLLYGKLNKLMD